MNYKPTREEIETELDEYLDIIIEIWEDNLKRRDALTDKKPERRMQLGDESIAPNNNTNE